MFLKVAVRAKGVERAVLITDAAMPTGCAPGNYKLGEVDVTLHAATADAPPKSPCWVGTVSPPSALSAGSCCRTPDADRTRQPERAVAMATVKPGARHEDLASAKWLQAGDRSDVVEFSYDAPTKSVGILRTWLDGRARLRKTGLARARKRPSLTCGHMEVAGTLSNRQARRKVACLFCTERDGYVWRSRIQRQESAMVTSRAAIDSFLRLRRIAVVGVFP